MEINPLKYLTIKRAGNIVQVVSSFLTAIIIREPIIWGLPVSYSIEPTNYCNLKCPECPSGLGELTRPIGLLKLNDFKEFIDQIKGYGFYIQLFFQGEPYINKDLPSMIRYAQDNNIYVSISTNGLLISKKNVDTIIENAPDKLIFSIDGLDEETYQRYRVGGTFKKADDSLKLLLRRKNEFGKKRPFVELQFIVMKQNEHQIDEVMRYGKDSGVDKVVLKTMQVSSYENAVHFLPDNQKYRRYILRDGKVKIKNKLRNHCFALWRTSVMTWDGKIVPCCFDKDANYELGNLRNHSLKEIWTSDKYREFRKGILDNRKGLEMCNNCTEGLKINIMQIES